MWPQKPGTAPEGMRPTASRVVPPIQGGAWPPVSPPGKLSARSARKHAPQLAAGQSWRGGLESLLPTDSRPGTRGKQDGMAETTGYIRGFDSLVFTDSRPGTRGKPPDATGGLMPSRSVRTAQPQLSARDALLLDSARADLQDYSVDARFGSTVQSSNGAFLTSMQDESSSLYQPNAAPFDSYQSPIQTRLQREIAHRSAKMIASLELSLSDHDEKSDCPASLVRLRFQEHRFLVDELYQQQDLRKELEEKYSVQKEELASCVKKLRRLEGIEKKDDTLEEIRRLRAYGESLEKDNHVTLQRLEQESQLHNDLQGICKVLLKSADLEWQHDHHANISQLKQLADLHIKLGSELGQAREFANAKAEQLRDLAHEHKELKEQMEETLQSRQEVETKHAELDGQCQALIEACGLEWHQDQKANLKMLCQVEVNHKELEGTLERLSTEHAELQSSHNQLEALYQQVKQEKQALHEHSRESADEQLKIHQNRVSVLEERCGSLKNECTQTIEKLAVVEGHHKDLKTNCEDLVRTVGLTSEPGCVANLRSQLATVGSLHVELQKQHADLLAVHGVMREDNAVILQREHLMVAEHEASCSSLVASHSAWERRYKELAKAHARLEMQWMELREWRMPEPEQEHDGTGHPKEWGITCRQLTQLHDEIHRDLEDYCSIHDFYLEDHDCVHVCRRQPCRFDNDHRNVKLKRRIEMTDRTVLKPMVPNMYIVVDRYLKPQCLAKGPGVSYSRLKNPDGLPITAFVSHTWLEPFRDFVNSLKIALDPDEAIWVCSFALPQAQKQGVSAMLSKDLNKVPFSLALKHAQKLVVVLDKGLSILQRAWCVYEIERARRWGIPTLLWAHQPSILMALRNSIDVIDFRQASATYQDDQDAIMKAIEAEGGYDILNDHLKRCIRDRAAICEMAISEMKGELNLSNDELEQLRKKVAEGTQNSNQCALDELMGLRRQLEEQLEQAELQGRSEGVEELKELMRKLQLDEAALMQEKNLLLQMSKDMEAMCAKDNTNLVIDGVSSKLLSILEPMLEQFMNENRRGIRGVRQSMRTGRGAGAASSSNLNASLGGGSSPGSPLAMSSHNTQELLALLAAQQGIDLDDGAAIGLDVQARPDAATPPPPPPLSMERAETAPDDGAI